jgi:hypothetical protein
MLARVAGIGLLAGALAGCGGIKVQPEPVLPKAVIQPMAVSVGLVVPGDMRNFVHDETRWGSQWKISLGPGHARMMHDLFREAFTEVHDFKDLESAKKAKGLKALFEPRIEQYSFATARETGGNYYAVTMRYRINLYTPEGEQADSYTLTGYGNAREEGLSSAKPLDRASRNAMRDAAAKFLVQFPQQPAGARLARNEAVIVEAKAAESAADAAGIDAVPIEESEQ